MSENFTKEDIDKLYYRFRKLDENQDGSISTSEFLQLQGIKENPLASRLLSLFDTDGSGSVSFEEFIKGISVLSSRSDKTEKMKFIFRVYDVDQDGFISNGELFHVLKLMVGDNLDNEKLQQVVDKTIVEADLDKDGKLSFDEFYAIIEKKSPNFIEKLTLSNI